MENKVFKSFGLIAGSGDLPILFCQEAKRNHGETIVIGIKGITNPELEKLASHFFWFERLDIKAIINRFLKSKVDNVTLLGKINPQLAFKKSFIVFKKWNLLRERNAHSIVSILVKEFKKEKIDILDSSLLLKSYLVDKGLLNNIKLNEGNIKELDFAKKIAKDISLLEVGQTIVTKKGMVVAVEGMEGTDKTIIRGGELAKGGVTIVKLAKELHDMRIDIPCVGPNTLLALKQAKANLLGLEAGRTFILDKEKFLLECDKLKISCVGI